MNRPPARRASRICRNCSRGELTKLAMPRTWPAIARTFQPGQQVGARPVLASRLRIASRKRSYSVAASRIAVAWSSRAATGVRKLDPAGGTGVMRAARSVLVVMPWARVRLRYSRTAARTRRPVRAARLAQSPSYDEPCMIASRLGSSSASRRRVAGTAGPSEVWPKICSASTAASRTSCDGDRRAVTDLGHHVAAEQRAGLLLEQHVRLPVVRHVRSCDLPHACAAHRGTASRRPAARAAAGRSCR